MSKNFKALVINQEGESFTRAVKEIDKSFLKHGDVLVRVNYSGLNYKDALILKNGARLVKEFPHIPGIDFSGTVEESQNDKFKPGEEIILTGWRVGEIFYGGYSQYAKVNGDFLVKKPEGLTSKQAMILGTAGLTALQCSFATKTAREELLLGVKVENNLDKALEWCDVANMLRLQNERMSESYFPSVREYKRYYGLTKERLNKLNKKIIIMHPGPINRGVEITSEVADSDNSIILNQVENGVAIRMAVIYLLAKKNINH